MHIIPTVEVNISDIIVSERLRKDAGDIEELADSIKLYGLLNPITLRRNGNRYVLLAGWRRLEAHKMLHRPTVQASVIS